MKWSSKEVAVLQKYYGKLQSKQIVELLPNRTVNAIALKAQQIGLKGNPSVTRRQLGVDLNFFSKPTPRSSYWAGFIAADGNIKKGKNLVRVKLGEQDRLHLEQFARDCKYLGVIKEAVKNKSSFAPNKKAFEFGVYAKQWIKDLYEKYNITPAKSLTLKPPQELDLKNTMAFICGIIDGDGCIYEATNWKNETIIGCSIIGTQAILEWIKSIIDIQCPQHKMAHTKSEVRLNKKGFYTYKFAGNRLKNFFYLIRELDLPILQRKWGKICTIT